MSSSSRFTSYDVPSSIKTQSSKPKSLLSEKKSRAPVPVPVLTGSGRRGGPPFFKGKRGVRPRYKTTAYAVKHPTKKNTVITVCSNGIELPITDNDNLYTVTVICEEGVRVS